MMMNHIPPLLLALAAITGTAAVATDEVVCLEGYVIDTFCLGVGFFPHVTTRSLHYPEVHSVHCMIDDVPCIGSGFEMVVPTSEAIDIAEARTAAKKPLSPYCRAYKFDQAGNDMLVEVAKSTGVCDDCHNNTTGEWVRGFRVTVFGTVSSPAIPGTQPAILAVTDIQHSSVGCEEHGGNVLPLECVAERHDLLDVQAPCWEEDRGCRNLDDPFTKPKEGNLPAHNVPEAPAPAQTETTTTEATADSSAWSLGSALAVVVGFVPLFSTMV